MDAVLVIHGVVPVDLHATITRKFAKVYHGLGGATATTIYHLNLGTFEGFAIEADLDESSPDWKAVDSAVLTVWGDGRPNAWEFIPEDSEFAPF